MKASKWLVYGSSGTVARKYGTEINTRNTRFQLSGEIYTFTHALAAGREPYTAWSLQPTGLRGQVAGTDRNALAEAKRQCDEAAQEYGISILETLGITAWGSAGPAPEPRPPPCGFAGCARDQNHTGKHRR